MTIASLYDRLADHLGCSAIHVDSDKFYVTFNSKAKELQVLPNFRLSEFLTRNTRDTKTILALEVMLLAQRIRENYGPLGINSSYRSPSYNASIGGASRSEHTKGNALDMYPIDRNIVRFTTVIEKMDLPGGFGKYNTFCHVDVRPYRARWDERTKT